MTQMDQSITIKIAGREYALKASSPEHEQLIRCAAEAINQKLSGYDSRFPNRDFTDKLAFVALNETINRINFQKKISAAEEEVATLKEDTDKYLKSIE